MTLQIIITFLILIGAIVLFVTEKLRVDLVALLVLVSLVFTGLVTPTEALSGFSNPAVVTVWAVFILSAGLSGTGVAHVIGRQVLRVAGKGEVRLLVIIMLTAAVLSGLMNNVGVVALLLPVVLTIAKQTRISPSKLLMPLATGCLLGGLTTLIGTPPNILASDALREFGLEPFSLFDFAPVGLVITLTGIAFMVLVGRHLLPNRHPVAALSGRDDEPADAQQLYDLEERLALVILPPDSQLAGKTLTESRIGRVLDLTILGVQRNGRKQITIHPETVLQGNDQLLVLGRLDRLEMLRKSPYFLVEDDVGNINHLFSLNIGLAEWAIPAHSPFIGQTITEIGMRRHYHFNVLAIKRNNQITRTNLQQLSLAAGDLLLLQGDRAALLAARQQPAFADGLTVIVDELETAVSYHLQERLLTIRIPSNSPLVEQTLAETHLGELFGLVALSIIREGQAIVAPPPETRLHVHDLLLIQGKPEALDIMRGLQGLVVKQHIQSEKLQLESEQVGLVEALLSPHSSLVNKTLRDIQFREKYGTSVLAIWRGGRAYRSELGSVPLQFGDAFLLYGPREKIKLLSREADFLVPSAGIQEAPRRHKAPLAVTIMTAVVITVLFGWLPISIAAITGSALLVLSGCLDMEEAYRQIDWRAVFLIAGMLPLGIAMERSGTARFIADGMVSIVAGRGSLALLTGLFVVTSLASQFMPNPVVTVLMAPIALSMATELSVSPYALMMIIAIAASASFMSPVGHPANVLVMGPGGYRFTDYLKIGVPMTVVVLLVTLLVLPVFWPL